MAAAWERGLSVIEKLVASAAYAADFDAHEVNLSVEIPVLRALTCIFGSSRFFRLRAHVRLSLVIDFEGPKRDPRVSAVGC